MSVAQQQNKSGREQVNDTIRLLHQLVETQKEMPQKYAILKTIISYLNPACRLSENAQILSRQLKVQNEQAENIEWTNKFSLLSQFQDENGDQILEPCARQCARKRSQANQTALAQEFLENIRNGMDFPIAARMLKLGVYS
jgi:hypothetical protein